jgi:hypothetical protein
MQVRISLVAQVSALYLDLLDLDNQLEISGRALVHVSVRCV